jgi:antitoxin component HigA of HigAB toxin-antitoxin module
MHVKPIKTEADYEAALREVELVGAVDKQRKIRDHGALA